jgi:carbamoyl-phosphate synthase large subunit
MRRILVTAIGGDVGHSILKCIDKTNNFIVGCDLIEYPVGLDLVDEYFISKNATDKSYLVDLLQKAILFEITHIIVVNEIEIKLISENQELFRNFKVLINSKFIVSTFLDKYETYKFLKSVNIDVPITYKVDEQIPNGKKYILKLKSSSGSKLLKIFTEKSQIEEIIKSDGDNYLIQEYIDSPNDEYTVGLFSNGDIINSITFKRELKGGYTKFVEYSNIPIINTLTEKIAKEISLKGSINIQLRIFEGRAYIFEINPRLSGTTNFRRKLGFDDVNWWLNYMDGLQIHKFRPTFKKAIGIRELNEKFLLIE